MTTQVKTRWRIYLGPIACEQIKNGTVRVYWPLECAVVSEGTEHVILDYFTDPDDPDAATIYPLMNSFKLDPMLATIPRNSFELISRYNVTYPDREYHCGVLESDFRS